MMGDSVLQRLYDLVRVPSRSVPFERSLSLSIARSPKAHELTYSGSRQIWHFLTTIWAKPVDTRATNMT
ncbi:MAG: hypothetical protein IGS48_15870 [Oscillatoriales cyanobacterium C42_A2020_001]|nr:hypothetical protein [Leptolyngbyaceae cyanobacterium C42_A2020_001]